MSDSTKEEGEISDDDNKESSNTHNKIKIFDFRDNRQRPRYNKLHARIGRTRFEAQSGQSQKTRDSTLNTINDDTAKQQAHSKKDIKSILFCLVYIPSTWGSVEGTTSAIVY